MEDKLKVGDIAPEFNLYDQNNKLISLSSFIGKKLILYFYPKDSTPGCTAEACNLRDNYAILMKQGFEIIGVSPDSLKKHENFSTKNQLPFSILSDEKKEVIKAYGVWGQKKFMGKEYMGVLRTTFVINEKGVIDKVFEKVKTKDHSNQILESYN
ncbi:MAG: thioredoxin-dependent thiol peroxidase [Bacteroidales bacterium]